MPKDGDGSSQEDEEEAEGDAAKIRTIDLNLISRTIVGLATYESKIEEPQMLKYKEFMDSHNEPSLGVQTFLIALGLLLINVIGKNMKNSYPEEYLMRKVLESFMLMRATNYSVSQYADKGVGYFTAPPEDGSFYLDYLAEVDSL